jgi:UDP-N-acetylglucosamine 2-epimerase (non-hydrolysing)
LEKIFEKHKPEIVLVQGDTTTALIGALAAFYKQIPVAHIEAGLRSGNLYNPFPEEMNRRLISQIANLHFAPTALARNNLLASGVASKDIFITGNTVIDALLWVVGKKTPFINPQLEQLDYKSRRIVLVTTHRRENIGEGMGSIFGAIRRLASEFPDLTFVFPVHLNPKIRVHAKQSFKNVRNVLLVGPLEYSDLANLMQKSYFVMTDSGGIQEEAPSLGKPVLVLRDTTERSEGIKADTAKLVGTSEVKIYRAAKDLLTSEQLYKKMSQAQNPYGDGKAAKRIVDTLLRQLG